MADPVAITTAIRGLLPLVRENLLKVRDAFDAGRDWRSYLGRVEMHRTIFQAWDETWTESVGRSESLDQNLSSFVGLGQALEKEILHQIVLLLRTFSDPEKLDAKYGLVMGKSALRFEDLAIDLDRTSRYLRLCDGNLTARDLTEFEDGRIRHIAYLERVRFDLSRRASQLQFDTLIDRLADLNQTLQLLSSPRIRDAANRKVFELAVNGIKGSVALTTQLAEAAAYEAKLSTTAEVKEAYDDLAKFANFALAIKSATAEMSQRKIFSRRDFSFDSPYELTPYATLARLFDYPTKYQSRLVLVEWLKLSRLAPVKQGLNDTKTMWFVLHAEKPEKLLLPASIGLIYDESDPRTVGLVFQLPPHIRSNLPTKPASNQIVAAAVGGLVPRVVRSPKTIAAERMPTSLRDLILKREPGGIPLGIRFKIAKKLLDSVYLMHTAGWIHRNIRPDNILFFPSRTRTGDPDPTTLDYSRPLLIGLHDAPLQITFDPDQAAAAAAAAEGLPKPILKNPLSRRPPPRDVNLACYQHPERRLAASPAEPFRRQFDLYAAGCVLLELGLWETLDTGAACGGREMAARAPRPGEVAPAADVWEDVDAVRRAAKKLDVITGSVYADVTRLCLTSTLLNVDILEFERGLAGTLAQIAA